MLEKNQTAPLFSVKNQVNEVIELSSFKGVKNVVLYFYPKDDTPGCTIEANDFTALVDKFSALDTVIIGVSQDSCTSHANFIDKYTLAIDLLADESGELCKLYDVWQLKEKNGIQKMAILRSTFIINKQGELVNALYNVGHEGHAQHILTEIEQL